MNHHQVHHHHHQQQQQQLSHHQQQQQIMPTAAAAASHNNHGQHLTAAPGFKRPGGVISDTEFPLRILVQSDMVGAIIGRSGSTIKQITQQSKARIDVHREESLDQQDKVITISGSPESCSIACFKIIEIIINETTNLQLNQNKNNSSSHLDDPERTLSSSENNNFADSKQFQDTEVKLKILAHNNLIGRLIGKSGNSIKKIMEQTSTKINISGNSLTDCTQERTITVVGKLSQVRQAEKVISSKLRAAYMSDVNVQFQAISQQPYLSNNVQLPYSLGPYGQNPILSSLVNSQACHGSHVMSRAIAGQHQNQLSGKPLFPNPSYFLSMYPNIGVPSPLLGFNPSSSLDVEKETVHLYIPSSMVGALIGKSGSAIKEMISTSGASIKVVAAPTTVQKSNAPVLPDEAQNNSSLSTASNADKDVEVDSPANLIQQDQIHLKRDSNSAQRERLGLAQESMSSALENGSTSYVPDCHTAASSSSPQPQTTSRYQNHNSNSSNNNNNNNSDSQQQTTRKVTIVGTPDAQWSAQYLIYRKVAMETGKSDISLMVEIQVPSQSVGKIIGKAGATVKNLQKQTRTTIRLPDDKPLQQTTTNSNDNADAINNNETLTETTVQITGEFQSTQMAQRHIRSLIKDRY